MVPIRRRNPAPWRLPSAVYWAATVLVVANFAFGGITVLAGLPASTEVFARLGYPGYFGAYLAVWQLMAVPALLIPGPRLLREWAYAGLAFDAISAIYSLEATGSPFVQLLPALFALALVLISYCGWAQRRIEVSS